MCSRPQALISLRPSEPGDADALYRIWQRAVDATHDFLLPEDRKAIEPLVVEYVRQASFTVAVHEGLPVAFMGVSDRHIDALFADPEVHRCGVGRLLADQVERPTTVDVNEQNEGAVAFYRCLGFQITGRSKLDDQGRPYPLLHLRRD